MNIPMKITVISVRIIGISHQTCNIAVIAPSRPEPNPTDRSMFAEMMTKTIPIARIAVTVACRDRIDKLRVVRKVPFVRRVKMIQIEMRAITIAYVRKFRCFIFDILLLQRNSEQCAKVVSRNITYLLGSDIT